MYPKNNASPPPIGVGQVIQISDGAVQTTGASARVKIGTGAFAAAGGTLACDSTSGEWYYTPTQAETNAESFIVAVYKASCIGTSRTVVTSISGTAGYAGVDWSNVANATSTVGLTGTTISTSQAVASVSGAVGSVTGNVGGSVASVTGAVGSVTGNVGGNVTGSVGSVLGGINTGSGTITTLDALDTAQDTQHAATQAAIPSAATIWSNGTRTLTAATNITTTGAAVPIDATTGDVQADVRYWVGEEITGLYMDLGGNAIPIVSVANMETGTITAAAVAADAVAEIQSGLSTLDAAGVRTAVGLAAANMDTQLAALQTDLDTVTDTGVTATNVASEISDALTVDTLIDGKTIQQALRIIGSLAGGKVSGAGTSTEVFIGLDGATTRVTVTADASGNRTAVVYA